MLGGISEGLASRAHGASMVAGMPTCNPWPADMHLESDDLRLNDYGSSSALMPYSLSRAICSIPLAIGQKEGVKLAMLKHW